jgi:hypothetical protein
MSLSGCGSELGADRIFNTTVHLTLTQSLTEQVSVTRNALNVAWVYRKDSTQQTQTQALVGAAMPVDCVSQNIQERYCITPSLDVIARNSQNGQFDVKVGAPPSWLLAASDYKQSTTPLVLAVIAICQESASGSPDCIKFANGFGLTYTAGLGFSLSLKLSQDVEQQVPADTEVVIEDTRELPRDLPKLVLSDYTSNL